MPLYSLVKRDSGPGSYEIDGWTCLRLSLIGTEVGDVGY
jgi:hypothetical protein